MFFRNIYITFNSVNLVVWKYLRISFRVIKSIVAANPTHHVNKITHFPEGELE